jgi:hypothetical protein
MRFVTFCGQRSACTGIGTTVLCNIDEGAQNNPACAAGQTCTRNTGGAIPYLASCK